MTTLISTLGFRRRGSKTWDYLYQDKPYVEETMSAATTMVLERPPERLHLTGDTKEKMGALLGAQQKGRDMLGKAVDLPKRAWGYIVETLNLNKVMDWVRGSLGWVGDKSRLVYSYTGASGLAGTAMVAAGTKSGRTTLKTMSKVVTKPVGWGYTGIKKVVSWVPGGKWVIEQVEKAEGWAAVQFLKVHAWYTEKVAKHVTPDAPLSSAVTAGGVFLVARKVLENAMPSWMRWAVKAVAGLFIGAKLEDVSKPVVVKLDTWSKEQDAKRVAKADATKLSESLVKVAAEIIPQVAAQVNTTVPVASVAEVAPVAVVDAHVNPAGRDSAAPVLEAAMAVEEEVTEEIPVPVEEVPAAVVETLTVVKPAVEDAPPARQADDVTAPVFSAGTKVDFTGKPVEVPGEEPISFLTDEELAEDMALVGAPRGRTPGRKPRGKRQHNSNGS
jgi:hypothetical protein